MASPAESSEHPEARIRRASASVPGVVRFHVAYGRGRDLRQDLFCQNLQLGRHDEVPCAPDHAMPQDEGEARFCPADEGHLDPVVLHVAARRQGQHLGRDCRQASRPAAVGKARRGCASGPFAACQPTHSAARILSSRVGSSVMVCPFGVIRFAAHERTGRGEAACLKESVQACFPTCQGRVGPVRAGAVFRNTNSGRIVSHSSRLR